MHHALQIQEILSIIFRHCYLHGALKETHTLAALARTCRTFKEPALDVLWAELHDLSPLARCLPQASHQTIPGRYAFYRRLEKVEWNILRSYTRRVRYISIRSFHGLVEWNLSLLKPPTTEPLFPNVRSLCFRYAYSDKRFLFPPVILPQVTVWEQCLCSFLTMFSKTSPSLTSLSIQEDHNPGFNMDGIDPTFIHLWNNLQTVEFIGISLNATYLAHLSRMSALSTLKFTLRATLPDQVPPPESPLVFSNLHDLELNSESLDSISYLLFHIRLPGLAALGATFESRPSMQDLSSLVASVQSAGSTLTLQNLQLDNERDIGDDPDDRPVLGFQDFERYRVFGNLRQIKINLQLQVNPSDGDLLALASAWPHLECLFINEDWGWNTLGGITPNGLLQLLQMCPSLAEIALAIDTRGYTVTKTPPFGVVLPRLSLINVVDSCIEAESVHAVVAFLTAIASPSNSHFIYWGGYGMEGPNEDVCKSRWKQVWRQVENTIYPMVSTISDDDYHDCDSYDSYDLLKMLGLAE